MRLGTPTFDSALDVAFMRGDELTFASPLLSRSVVPDALSFECAGPQKKLFFDPTVTTVGIVSCGGLCPGINNVIRALLLELHHAYGVHNILGFRYGLEGLVGERAADAMRLSPESVRHVHRLGGSMLGVSRGRQPTPAIVDALVRTGTDILFAIGGNGTMRAVHEITTEIARRHLRIAVVALPKTIDDDIAFVDKSFGFDTAVEQARAVIDAAHAEALSARNGVGIVKVMGRDVGFIAANAALASGEANFVLLPETPFAIDGNAGLLAALERRLMRRGHAVIVVAEGCGAALAPDDARGGASIVRDPSGNVRYGSRGLDVGPWLCQLIERHFASAKMDITLKYINPSYTIRAAAANACDAIYGTELARNAVHTAMAGHTNVLVGRCHGVYVRLPLELVITNAPTVSPELRFAVDEVTGQPNA